MWLRRFAWTSLYSLKAKNRKKREKGKRGVWIFQGWRETLCAICKHGFPGVEGGGGFKYNYEMY
jgi:hypothetical protein